MQKRLLDAGFAKEDVVVLGPNSRKGNMVARLRGTGAKKPILLIGHLDVVEARREDWTTDPFQFVEKDGYFYGRGTQDMKSGDAIMVTTFIRMKQEGYKPDRDIILALTADEEGGKSNGVDWLLNNHRDLIEAEYVLNHDGGGVDLEHGKTIERRYRRQRKALRRFSAHRHQPRRPQLASGAGQRHLSPGRRAGTLDFRRINFPSN
jgi:acetylornithine deacetylase/succinyl-diaminopimelate desuccinylase-like protein